MAKLDQLSTRLLWRLKDVPNVTLEDATEWVRLSLNEHGYTDDADIPENRVMLILLYAEADAATNISFRTAYYFQYKDGEETVDKRNVSEQYRKIATELWKLYDRKKQAVDIENGTTRFHIRTRADR